MSNSRAQNDRFIQYVMSCQFCQFQEQKHNVRRFSFPSTFIMHKMTQNTNITQIILSKIDQNFFYFKNTIILYKFSRKN